EETIAADIDSGLTVEEAKRILRDAGYAAILLGSRHHQKPKEDKPACDRFRVILLLERRVTHTAEHGATWLQLNRLFGGRIDRAAKDASRFYFPSPTELAVLDGRPFPVVAAPKAPERVSGPVAGRTLPGAMAAFWKSGFVTVDLGSRHEQLVEACK